MPLLSKRGFDEQCQGNCSLGRSFFSKILLQGVAHRHFESRADAVAPRGNILALNLAMFWEFGTRSRSSGVGSLTPNWCMDCINPLADTVEKLDVLFSMREATPGLAHEL